MADFGDQFGRWWRVSIGGLTFTSDVPNPLTIRFKVETDKSLVANNAELLLLNLRKESRESLEQEEGVSCQIEAGYQTGAQNTIFFGVVKDPESYRAGPDWVTRLSAEDSNKEIVQARIAKTWAKGTPYLQVLKDLVTSLGVKPGNVDKLVGVKTKNGEAALPRAYTATGSTSNELRWLARALELNWSVQQGAFVGSFDGTPASQGGPLISPATGLVGAPRVNDKGHVSARALMQPDMVPHTAFRLESQKVKGDYEVEAVTFIGDTTGQEWYTDFEGKPL